MIEVKDQSAESSNALPRNSSVLCARALVFSSSLRVSAEQRVGMWS